MKLLLFDNEAVQALLLPGHPKEREVLPYMVGVVHRRRAGRPVRAVVPTSVRVEAGWDRRSAAAAAINRLRIEDAPLVDEVANESARIQQDEMLGVADSHLGAVVQLADPSAEVTVLTSDPGDIRRACGARSVTVVTI